TKTGTVVGTITYLSPEQVTGDEIDRRSDIYSLGIVLYECLTGAPPFSGEVQSVLYRVTHENPQPIGALVDVEEQLDQIIMQCLEKDPLRRPQHARELAESSTRYRAVLRDSDRVRAIGSTVGTVSTLYRRPMKSALVGR